MQSKKYIYIKRGLDIILGIVGMGLFCVLSILFVFPYSFGANKGKMFYKQKRLGQNGKYIYIYKFRSMIENAEEELLKNEILYLEYISNNYKIDPEKDPRITKFGKFIRKTSLDEFPQFINVLKGELSIVGPRPIVPEELTEYGERKHLFLKMKPGLTGYWQAYGRSTIPYPDRCDLELQYIEDMSMYTDIKIIVQTIKSVLLQKGAY